MYLDQLRKTIPECLKVCLVTEPTKDRDMEFGEITGRKHEWRTRFACNKVTGLFVLVLDNNDDERYVFFTFGSPIASLKYVGLVDYNENMAFNCDSGEFEPLFDDLLAIIKTFSLAD